MVEIATGEQTLVTHEDTIFPDWTDELNINTLSYPTAYLSLFLGVRKSCINNKELSHEGN